MKAVRLCSITVVLLLFWAILPWGTSASRKTRSARTTGGQVTSRASTSPSWLRFSDGVELTTNYKDEANPAAGLRQMQGAALSLAAGDFDEDGVPDLVNGHSEGNRGVIVWQRGNVDALYPNTSEARGRRAQGQLSDGPFLPDARTFAVPTKSDFIGAGDFDADGHWDVVTATSETNALFFLRGDGRGSFAEPERIELPGKVTTVMTGDLNRRDGLTDVAVGVTGDGPPQLLVFENAAGALRAAPESLPLPAAATSIALGQLDESFEMDLVVAAGNQLLLIPGRDRRTSLDEASRAQVPPAHASHLAFEVAVVSVAVGDFVGDYQDEIALLTEDGTVRIMERGVDPATSEDSGTPKTDARNPTDAFAWWHINDAATISLPVSTASAQNLAGQKLVSAKVSSLPKDDLIIIDDVSQSLQFITAEPNNVRHVGNESLTVSDRRVAAGSLSLAGAPAAVLPMRLKDSALESLVISHDGSISPLIVSPLAGATLTVNSNLVTNTRDAVLTLNEAIRVTNGTLLVSTLTAQEQAQISGTPANPGLDTIQFNIPGSGVPTITDNLSIPAITDALTLDGTTQPGGRVALESPGAQAVLRITAGNSTVRGMVLNRGCRGIQLATNGSNVIEGNFIGTSTDGTSAGIGNICSQIEIDDSTNNTIGGPTAAARNILSGALQPNNNFGVHINGPSATGNLIQGNYIGPNVTGNTVIGNRSDGIYIATSTSINNTIGGTTAGAGNVISGNGTDTIGGQAAIRVQAAGQLIQGNIIGLNKDGTDLLASSCSGVVVNSVANITIGGTSPAARNVISGNGTGGLASHAVVLNGATATNCLIQGNYIGTNASGTSAMRNLGHGVTLPGPSNITIGGAVSGARNLISGNMLDGVNFSHVPGVQATGNQVQGNYIGTDVNGTLAIANQSDGIEIGVNTGGMGTLIGGTTTSLRNVISGNSENGILIQSSAKTNPNRIEGNYIGPNTFGTGALGNGQHGVFIIGNTDGQNIGGTNAGTSNLIAFNAGPGIASEAGRAVGASVLGNSIFSNNGLGIDRRDDGPTANVTSSTENAPVLTSVNNIGSATRISGTLQESHNGDVPYFVQFFSNDACDPSGFGEGQALIGQTTVLFTNNNSTVSFTADISPAVTANSFITAVAIAVGAPAGVISSEFSSCVHFAAPTPSPTPTIQVFAVTPNHGGDTGSVTSEITGQGFQTGATVKLTRSGQSDIAGQAVSIAPTELSLRTTFNLVGKAKGAWNVVVTNPDGHSATLPDAFTIEQTSAAKLWVDVLGRNAIPPHRPSTLRVIYGNLGNVDVYDVVLMVHLPKGVSVTGVDGLVVPPGVQAAPGLDGVSMQTDTETLVPIWFYVLPAGVSRTISLVVNMQDRVPPPGSFELKAQLLMPPSSEAEFSRTGDFSTLPAWFGPSHKKNPFFLALLAMELGRVSNQVTHGGSSSRASKSVSAFARLAAQAGGGVLRPLLNDPFDPNDPDFDTGGKFNDALHNGTFQGALDQGPIPFPYAYAAGFVLTILAGAACVASSPLAVPLLIAGGAFTIWGIVSTGTSAQEAVAKYQVHIVSSLDPNEKVGSPGAGPPRYIPGQEPLRYAIYFENKPDASAPAQTVVVTDQLDMSKMDLSTFSLGTIGFGDSTIVTPPFGLKSFSADVDLRPAKNLVVRINCSLNSTTGVVTWAFTSIDPATGQPPDDVLVGFLPPNQNGTQGEGSVLFTVMPKAGVAAGTEIRNHSRIVFDTNAPIDTNEWLNTIDNSSPVSHVAALNSTQPSIIFNVNWSGTDTGSGVRDYNVYVSTNGGPYELWLANTSQTSAYFIGQPQKTYSFFSVATDNANNREAIKNSAEANTATRTDITNSLDDTRFFVHQHYLDFLSREPDPPGWDFWTNNVESCGSDSSCREVKRINTSAAFFLSIEFQGTSYLVERIYKAAYGDGAGSSTFGGAHQLPVPIIRLNEFLPDTQEIGQGVIVNQPGWETILENNKQAFIAEFVQRSRFTSAFPTSMTAAQFVDTLNANAGGPLSQSERNQLVGDLSTGAKTRAQVLRAVAEDSDLYNAEFNRAFVLMQYFGYLRRNPNDLQDTDYSGYDFWLRKLNQFNGNFINAEMVKAFITSIEYRQRFGP